MLHINNVSKSYGTNKALSGFTAELDDIPRYKIEGKVWNVPCTETEVTEYQRRFRVTNIAKTESGDGKIVLRVLSEERPTEDSVHVAPALEDYYLYIFGESHAL